MLDRLIDLFLALYQSFIPWIILDEYERGVVLRLGRKHRVIGPGFHWRWPFGIERYLYDSVVTNTACLAPQSLTTSDGVSIVVSAVITSHVTDVEKLLLECEDKDQALIDSAFGVIANLVSTHKWEEIHTERFAGKMTLHIKRKGARFGLAVESVQFRDVSKCRSIRLWNDAQ